MPAKEPTRPNSASVRKTAKERAHSVAVRARLIVPLPSGTDLTEAESDDVINMLGGFIMLEKANPLLYQSCWLALAAKHLADLARALRAVSKQTQPKAFATILAIFAFLPEENPIPSPYLCAFLDSRASDAIPTIMAKAFVQGIDHLGISRPSYICCLLKHFLLWGRCSDGDDGRAPIDQEWRVQLREKVDAIIKGPEYSTADEYEKSEYVQLVAMLDGIEEFPGNRFLALTRDTALRQSRFRDCINCNKEIEEKSLICAQCKLIRYCSKTCQVAHWKNMHKAHCFTFVE